MAFLKALILLPVAVIVILLAVANRSPVLLSLDPFSKGAPEIAFSVPLYAVIFAAAAVGVIIGGFGAWLSAGSTRRSARMSHREAKRLRQEADRLRAAVARSGPTALPGLPAPRA